MVIRETPKNKENFIMVNNQVGNLLQTKGFIPKYMDFDYLYFVRTEELKVFMESEGLI